MIRMVAIPPKLFWLIILTLVLVPGLHVARKLPTSKVDDGESLKACRFDQIYQFGDSIADTGNRATEAPQALSNRFPYGMTLGKPTGRCSNGMLMIDYFARAYGLPFLNPYERVVKGADFKHGVNFAVAGSTALSEQSLKARGIWGLSANASLHTQLQWMQSHLNYICQHKLGDCENPLKNSLVFVGEIGGNDYNYALLTANKPINQLDGLIKEVVQTIVDAVRTVIKLGATNVIVPGNFPIGCVPVYLNRFPTQLLDSNKCWSGLNRFAAHHNNILQAAIQQLRNEHPNVAIVYADYYNAFLSILNQAQSLGFKDKFSACCGHGTRSCGLPGVPACPNPDDHISWDGIHMTQQAYKFMSYYLLRSFAPQMHCN